MKKLFFCFTLLFISISAVAQEDHGPVCGMAEHWLVQDGETSAIWVHPEGNRFKGYWGGDKPFQDTVTISFDGQEVFINRVENVCRYRGEINEGGLSMSGTSDCGGQWSARVFCGTPPISWGTSATAYRLAVETTFTFFCPPAPENIGAIWGTDIYTDDSAICAAAAHAGAIKMADGGTVSIEILPGRISYRGSEQNGLTSRPYGTWPGSYRVSAEPGIIPVITWNFNVIDLRGLNERRFQFECLPRTGIIPPVWGTEIYTDDSSVCGAALHAGLIDEKGGQVTVEILPGQRSYQGSENNGVTTSNYGGWLGSFTFQEPATPETPEAKQPSS